MAKFLENYYPDYQIGKAASGPISMIHNLPYDAGDQVRALQGSLTPCVLINYAPLGGAGSWKFWGQDSCYGRITSSKISLDNVQGDPLIDEVARVQSLTLEEEL